MFYLEPVGVNQHYRIFGMWRKYIYDTILTEWSKLASIQIELSCLTIKERVKFYCKWSWPGSD